MARMRKQATHALIGLDMHLSRIISANTAGLYRLHYGNHIVQKNRAGNECIVRDGSWECGYKKLGNLLDAKLVNTIVEKYNSLIDDPHVFIRRANLTKAFMETGKEYNRILRPVGKYIPEINDIIANQTLKSEIESYFGTPFRALTSEAWRNWHVTPELERRGVLSNHWHHDSFRADTVKLYMLMHDTELRHGPFHFLDAQKSKQAVRASKTFRIDKEVPDGVSPSDVNRLTGKKGDLMLINTIHCLHRAGNPADGESRDILELRLLSVAQPGSTLTFDQAN